MLITASYPVSGSISDLSVFRACPGLPVGHAGPRHEHDHPARKPKNRDLDPDRVAANGVWSGVRSAVERAIAHLKYWKILSTGYRGRLGELPAMVRTIIRLERCRTCW
jgi:hypothetical protein